MHSRRDFLRTMAVAGAGAMLPASGQQARPAGRIDVHHHMIPPGYVTAMQDELKRTNWTPRQWSPAISLETMDKNGIATSILSPVQRLVLDSMSETSERARMLARLNNDFGAQVVRDHPDRFGLFAALPLPDRDGSLREIEYAYDTLKADGIALWTSYRDKWPGDPAFDAVFAELNRRNAVVFFHPAAGSCCRDLMPGLGLSGIIEYDLDTARTAESLLYNGTPARYPNIRFIFSHSGGAITTLADRMIDDYPKDHLAQLPHGVEYEFRRFYYETAHAGKPAALDALKDLAPVSQILFGSDVPIRNYELTTNPLSQYRGFSVADWQAINRGNAERLFPRLKT